MNYKQFQFDVLVIGGGVAGLTTAFYLLEEGKKVFLVEQKVVGQEASWAGGGILSPLKPWRYSKWHERLTALSLRCLEVITARMAAVGITFETNKTGLLYANESIDSRLTSWLDAHKNVTLLKGKALEDLCKKLPLSSEWVSSLETGIWMPEISNLRNPHFLQALRAYLLQHPDFVLQENAKASLVLGSQTRFVADDRLLGVDLELQGEAKVFLPVHDVVITAGAWSTRLLPQNLIPEIKPIRGQMLLFKPQAQLSMMIMHGDHYMIPRMDGLVLVGSTVEDVGFEKGTTVDAEKALHQFAATIFPELQGVAPIRHWSGLRPAVAGMEGIPLLGAVTQTPGLWINSGHYRNGIIHASGAARLVVDAMQGREPELPLTLDHSGGFVIPQVPISSIDSAVI